MTTTQQTLTSTDMVADHSSLSTIDTADLASRPGLAEAWNQTMGFASGALKKMRRQPEQFADVAIQPSLFTMMFGFVFGGGISGDVVDFTIMVPSILAIACLTTGDLGS